MHDSNTDKPSKRMWNTISTRIDVVVRGLSSVYADFALRKKCQEVTGKRGLSSGVLLLTSLHVPSSVSSKTPWTRRAKKQAPKS